MFNYFVQNCSFVSAGCRRGVIVYQHHAAKGVYLNKKKAKGVNFKTYIFQMVLFFDSLINYGGGGGGGASAKSLGYIREMQ